jgi:hypothetical protein
MRGTILAGAILLTATAATAATYVSVVPVSGSTSMNIQGINDKNQIVGGYLTADGVEHGFAGSVDGTYQTFDLGAQFTEPHRMNNFGTIVGNADDGLHDGLNVAFERSLKTGTTVDVTIDGAPFVNGQTLGINNQGIIVGYAFSQNDTVFHAYYGRKGKYTSDLTIPQGSLVDPRGINDSNAVVGSYLTGAGLSTSVGFVLQSGVSTAVVYPDSRSTGIEFNDINDSGTATGEWLDAHHRPHAFKYDTTTASFTRLRPPGSSYSWAWGINKRGLIAVTSDVGSFIYCPNAKRCPSTGTAVQDDAPVKAVLHR